MALRCFPAVLVFSLILVFPSISSPASEVDCRKCHARLMSDKVKHAALTMGCPVCHPGIDASTVPHKRTNALPKGLSAAQPDLCYTCHDKAKFDKKDVHPAIITGCTNCHNPHSSGNVKLLAATAPNLCFPCHDKREFTGKDVHKPVASGACLACHVPHASDEMALLLKRPLDTCLQCHKDASHGRHFTVKQRTTNGEKSGKPEETEPQDPERPGKPFYCGTCHNPHSTDSPLLFRFGAQSVTGLCDHCHKMR